METATRTLLRRIASAPPSVGRWGPRRRRRGMDDAVDQIRMQGDRCRVPGERGRGIRARFGVQSAHPSHPALHQLRSAAEEQRTLLATRRVVLQLPPRRTGQSVQTRLQRHHSLPELK